LPRHSKDRAPSGISGRPVLLTGERDVTRRSGISEQQLHDYVDGRLAPEDRSRIAAHLDRHAGDRARVSSYRAITRGLHALYDGALREPIPDKMSALLARHRRRKPDPQ
jgi:anti-sigma factor RsiW